jgi:hypothetical protein
MDKGFAVNMSQTLYNTNKDHRYLDMLSRKRTILM